MANHGGSPFSVMVKFGLANPFFGDLVAAHYDIQAGGGVGHLDALEVVVDGGGIRAGFGIGDTCYFLNAFVGYAATA